MREWREGTGRPSPCLCGWPYSGRGSWTHSAEAGGPGARLRRRAVGVVPSGAGRVVLIESGAGPCIPSRSCERRDRRVSPWWATHGTKRRHRAQRRQGGPAPGRRAHRGGRAGRVRNRFLVGRFLPRRRSRPRPRHGRLGVRGLRRAARRRRGTLRPPSSATSRLSPPARCTARADAPGVRFVDAGVPARPEATRRRARTATGTRGRPWSGNGSASSGSSTTRARSTAPASPGGTVLMESDELVGVLTRLGPIGALHPTPSAWAAS